MNNESADEIRGHSVDEIIVDDVIPSDKPALTDEFNKLPTKLKLQVIEMSLQKLGNKVSYFHRSRLKRWAKKMKRQLHNEEKAVKGSLSV